MTLSCGFTYDFKHTYVYMQEIQLEMVTGQSVD